MRPIIVLAHGILTRQTVASWPDQFHSWLELELHGANANVLKKEYIAGPFPLWNVLVKNRLLARGPRFRVDAESLRDTALSLGGLLVEELGGRSVKPFQPAGPISSSRC